MTTILNASSSSGLVATADTSAILQLQTGSTAAVTIDASQNVGIGTASPAYNLQVSKTVAAGSVISQINNPSATGAARLYLGNDSGESAAYFQVFGSSHAAKPSVINIGGNASYPLVFDTAGTERMRINAGAPILCLSGGNTSATGTGIAFPATQSASSDANTLDDYEEGTFTPALSWLGTITYSAQSGTYTKVGRLVTCTIFISASSTDTTQDATTMNFSSLPFTVSSASPSCAMTENIKGTISATAPNTFFVYPTGTTTTAAMYQNNYNGTTAQKSYYGGLPRSGYNGGLAVITATFSYLTST
jgi:hypothetical protein